MDITKCKGINCPLKESCFRYTAKAGEFQQSYFTEVPYDKETGTCPTYWGVSEEAVIKQLEQIFED